MVGKKNVQFMLMFNVSYPSTKVRLWFEKERDTASSNFTNYKELI